MEREYNEYLQLTRKYLRNYAIYTEAVENLTRRLRELEVELSAVSISSPMGGEGGGKGELTPVEREADRRIERRDQYNELFEERNRMKKKDNLLHQKNLFVYVKSNCRHNMIQMARVLNKCKMYRLTLKEQLAYTKRFQVKP